MSKLLAFSQKRSPVITPILRSRNCKFNPTHQTVGEGDRGTQQKASMWKRRVAQGSPPQHVMSSHHECWLLEAGWRPDWRVESIWLPQFLPSQSSYLLGVHLQAQWLSQWLRHNRLLLSGYRDSLAIQMPLKFSRFFYLVLGFGELQSLVFGNQSHTP